MRVLAIAASGLLLADPFLLRSVGFLLSCGASAGILLFGEPIARRLPGPRLLRETAGVTLAAQLGTAPILVPVFGSVPLVALPANLVAVPLAAPITVVGLVAGVVGGLVRPFWPGAATVLQLPVLGLAAGRGARGLGGRPGTARARRPRALGSRRRGRRRAGPAARSSRAGPGAASRVGDRSARPRGGGTATMGRRGGG